MRQCFFGVILMTAVLLGGVGCGGRQQETVQMTDFPVLVSKACDKVFPALVFIQVVRGNLESGRDQSNVVSGSGVLISRSGELLTNWHVVDKAQAIRCLLYDGREFPAKLVGSDKDIDLALLQLELPENTPELPVAEIDSKQRVKPGDFVMAMGAPWGLSRSVSLGIISSASRYLPGHGEYSLWYQTDASISPGNSGGPLVDMEGEVVGINTLGVMYGGTVGFSIPAEIIHDALPRLREYNSVNWAWLGLHLQPLADFGRNIRFDYQDGVIVSGTAPGGPARRAGFLPNDRIVAMNGGPVTVRTEEQLPKMYRRIGLMPFGQDIRFTVMRDGKELELAAAPVPKGQVEGDEGNCPRWGFTAKTINRFDTPNLFYYCEKGVYIYGIADIGNASRADCRINDIIVSINGRETKTLDELKTVYREAMDKLSETTKAVFVVMRNGRMMQFVLDYYNDYETDKE